MNIVRINAGLGNQMFQYAFFRALKTIYNDTKIDISEFKYRKHHNGYELEKIFNITPNYASAKESNAMIDMSKNLFADIRRTIFKIKYKGNGELVQEQDARFHPEFLTKTNAYFIGYWQTEKYFLPVADVIRKEFSFRNELDRENKQIAEQIKNSHAVSIHVRCGDYLKKRRIDSFGSVCTPIYYNNAIDYIQSKAGNVRFFVFSDDIAWTKSNLQLPANAVFVDINHGKESYKDMQLMSLCRHNIIANSSFSWWGAWLNSNPDKIVVAPGIWFRGTEMPDVLPEAWIKMSI